MCAPLVTSLLAEKPWSLLLGIGRLFCTNSLPIPDLWDLCTDTAEVTRKKISRSFRSSLQSWICAIREFLIRAVRVLTRVRKGERIVGQPRGSLPLCRLSGTQGRAAVKMRNGPLALCAVALSSTCLEIKLAPGNNDAVAFAYGRELVIRVPES